MIGHFRPIVESSLEMIAQHRTKNPIGLAVQHAPADERRFSVGDIDNYYHSFCV